ncbi:HAD-superfamily hydrolase [Trichodelitschia bisporula]|uniref:HAD-superfamily hydrolase n=1 Tax=Trichodelitschia bisporula TaxID=703511 RepID=A0A6G1HN89_9PEZI|nr:HAD-superfamily hydrolase [Trichodelitschia bisporula]
MPNCTFGVPQRRHLQQSAPNGPVPDFAFAFDIDGVLLRSSSPLPHAHTTLSHLQQNRIPFILLTNGGGTSEEKRVEYLSSKLEVPLHTDLFIQSHTLFVEKEKLKKETVLVVGGDGDNCRKIAEGYGYKRVVVPADYLVAGKGVWPFSRALEEHYKSFARPLPQGEDAAVKAIFVFNDSRDWGLDATVILDLLLSEGGKMGTLSPRNGDPSLPDNGWQQDGQPRLWFSNPDLWWASEYPLPRLGQGGFRAAVKGVWTAATGRHGLGMNIVGKPHRETYAFAERRLGRHRESLFEGREVGGLKRVYMIGDNPESDIRGANSFKSPRGTEWTSILVRTGVYRGGEPAHQPAVVVDDVGAAVRWALEKEGWA